VTPVDESRWVAHLTRSIRPPQWKGERTTYLKLSYGDEPEVEAGSKVCPRCKRELPKTTDYFFRASRKKSGLMDCCKDCHKASARAAYHRRREAVQVIRPGEASRLEGGAA
jgi:hypothetical protein